MSMIDPTMDVIQKALDGLAARQRATANNVANVETPDFKATKVDFETNLRTAVAENNPEAASIDISKSSEPNGPNGNNVRIDDETVSMIDSGLRYQTMVEAMNMKFRLLRSAIGS